MLPAGLNEYVLPVVPGFSGKSLPTPSQDTFLPTSSDIESRLPLRSVSATPVGRATTEAGKIVGGLYTGPMSPLRVIASTPSAVSHAAKEFAMATAAPAHVIKPKGGNWLDGVAQETSDLLKKSVFGGRDWDPLRQLGMTSSEFRALPIDQQQKLTRGLMTPEQIANDNVNKWLDNTLTKYIKNDMSTEKDPIRLGIDAWRAEKVGLLIGKQMQIDKAIVDMEKARATRGFTPEMMTQSQARIRELEKERELIERRTGLHGEMAPVADSDYSNLNLRREFAGFPAQGMGISDLARKWESVTDAATRVRAAEEIPSGQRYNNPWLSKVPPETPIYSLYSTQLSRLGQFPHLVDELANALNPTSGLPVNLLLKEKDFTKMNVAQASAHVDKINAWRSVQRDAADLVRANNAATHTFKEYAENNPKGMKWVELKMPELGRGDEMEGGQLLKDALSYEGNQMAHCVGGYCDDVIQGRSKIFSLRDSTGKPHATIEVTPPSGDFKSLEEFKNSFIETHGQDTFDNYMLKNPQLNDAFKSSIAQIKGRSNSAPSEEALPFIQDFVKSGKWESVNNLGNAGLYKLPDNRFITKEQYDQAIQQLPDQGPGLADIERRHRLIQNDPSYWEESKHAFEGFAHGGFVEYNPNNINGLVARFEEEMYG
jgi:hypothetical protein